MNIGKKYDYWCIDRSHCLKSPKLVQMIVSIYKEQGYKVPIVNPRWPPKIKDGRHDNQFLDIFASYLESDSIQRTKN